MTGLAKIGVVGCLCGLMLSLCIAVGGEQAQTPSAPALTPPVRTYGAPPGLFDVARQIEDLLKQQAFDKALALCQQRYDSAADDEARAFFLRYKGEVYMAARSGQCLQCFDEVIQRFPKTQQVSWARMDIAWVYYHKAKIWGHVKENAAIYMPMVEQLLKDYPKHEMAAGALYAQGWGYENLGNDPAALAQYQKAVDAYVRYPWTDLCAQRVYELHQKSGRWDEAIAAARRYIELFPFRGPYDAQVAIGMCYMGKADPAQAIVEFDKVLSQYPDRKPQCAQALLQKGLCQKTLGQLAAAKSTFEQVIQAYPNGDAASKAKQELALLAGEG